jgi:hypothetical protein
MAGRIQGFPAKRSPGSLTHDYAAVRQAVTGLWGNRPFYSVYAQTHAAPGRALSLASQLPPRPPQPPMSAGLRKQLVGATFFSTRYISDRMRHLAGPYRWQASSHPDLRSRQCRQGCASSLWEPPSFLLGHVRPHVAPGRAYRWQASSHPDLRSRQCRQGCASSLWEQPSFLLGICSTACVAWQGPIAGKPAPTQTSAAVNVGRAAQAAYGSNLLFYSVHVRPHAASGRALSLASQLPPRPL